jgi:hypothetical protein
LKENNPPWEEAKVTSQPSPKAARPPPGLEFPHETRPALYSSSSSEDMKFKPTTLPETIASELKSKLSTHDSDNSEHKNSFAIIDDENISGSCSESGTRPSPLARPNPRYLSRNLFGETPKLLSPAAFKPTTAATTQSPITSQVNSRKNSTNSNDTIIHREYLKQSLIALLEDDTDFLNKIHLAYINQVKSKFG